LLRKSQSQLICVVLCVRRRARCKECGGGSICEHKRQRRICKECKGMFYFRFVFFVSSHAVLHACRCHRLTHCVCVCVCVCACARDTGQVRIFVCICGSTQTDTLCVCVCVCVRARMILGRCGYLFTPADQAVLR
jgi:hypothetical protein